MKTLLHVLLFVASLLGTSTFLRQFDALPFWGWSAHKLEVIRSQGDPYDTIFLGSSRLHYAAMPEVFDARSAELGRKTSSYSLAFSGTRMLDTVRILDWLVANKPRNCKRVVIELHATTQDIRWTQWMTDQEIEMHAPCVFVDRLRSIWISPSSIGTRWLEAGYCAIHTITDQLCIGQGVRILEDWIDVQRGEPMQRIQPVPDRGWVGVEASALEHMRKFHEGFGARWPEWERVVFDRIKDPTPEWLAGGFDADAVLSIARRLRLVGIEPVFLVMPSLSMDFRGREGLERVRRECRVLELDRPAEHRPLFDKAFYYDPSHLGTEGARAFSRYLAEQLVACEELPLDQDPPAHRLPSSGIAFSCKRVDGGADRIELAADELPFAGEAVVIASTETRETPLPGGVVLGVPWPAQHLQSLQRDSVYRASGAAEWAGVDPSKSLYLQLAVVEKDVVIAVSPVVELPPRR